MKAIRQFKEYVQIGIVRKQSPDRPRAEFLMKESENSYLHLTEIIKAIGIKDTNANDYIKSCYDIFMELIRAKMLLDGYTENSGNYTTFLPEFSNG